MSNYLVIKALVVLMFVGVVFQYFYGNFDMFDVIKFLNVSLLILGRVFYGEVEPQVLYHEVRIKKEENTYLIKEVEIIFYKKFSR